MPVNRLRNIDEIVTQSGKTVDLNNIQAAGSGGLDGVDTTNANHNDSLVWDATTNEWVTTSDQTDISGEASFTTAGEYTWTPPANYVSKVSVVCVGGGGGGYGPEAGAGGGLAWANDISVTFGTTYTISVGAGGDRWQASGGQAGQSAAFGIVATGGARGGSVGTDSRNLGYGSGGGGGGGNYGAGGGGAGGYTGNGWSGANGGGSSATNPSGGGGAGGAGGQFNSGTQYMGGGGGGVGLYGEGESGRGASNWTGSGSPIQGGGGGSGGSDGEDGSHGCSSGGTGGLYGGGGGSTGNGNCAAYGAGGAVRIIWGVGRSFPDNAA